MKTANSSTQDAIHSLTPQPPKPLYEMSESEALAYTNQLPSGQRLHAWSLYEAAYQAHQAKLSTARERWTTVASLLSRIAETTPRDVVVALEHAEALVSLAAEGAPPELACPACASESRLTCRSCRGTQSVVASAWLAWAEQQPGESLRCWACGGSGEAPHHDENDRCWTRAPAFVASRASECARCDGAGVIARMVCIRWVRELFAFDAQEDHVAASHKLQMARALAALVTAIPGRSCRDLMWQRNRARASANQASVRALERIDAHLYEVLVRAEVDDGRADEAARAVETSLVAYSKLAAAPNVDERTMREFQALYRQRHGREATGADLEAMERAAVPYVRRDPDERLGARSTVVDDVPAKPLVLRHRTNYDAVPAAAAPEPQPLAADSPPERSHADRVREALREHPSGLSMKRLRLLTRMGFGPATKGLAELERRDEIEITGNYRRLVYVLRK